MRKPLNKIPKVADKRRMRRRLSIRKKISGTAERPRICLSKSNKNLLAQVINDVDSKTLFSVQTFGKNAVKGATNNVEGAKALGGALAKKFKDNKLETAVFDRAGYKYTGVVTAFVDSLRENGVQI